jgi:hypothetical protein
MKQKTNSPKLQRPCEYHYPNCQKVTDLQYIRKLGSVTISKTWICDNCKAYLDQAKAKH